METRNTIQRALVLEAVRRFAGHGTAEELYQAVAQRYPHIRKGTVYRNLQRLCELGEIRRVEVPDGADRYDRILEDHYHVRCDGCGRVSDVGMAYLPRLEEAVEDRHGFLLTGHTLLFRGLCPECQRKRGR